MFAVRQSWQSKVRFSFFYHPLFTAPDYGVRGQAYRGRQVPKFFLWQYIVKLERKQVFFMVNNQ
jgi:hypothetical protein